MYTSNSPRAGPSNTNTNGLKHPYNRVERQPSPLVNVINAAEASGSTPSSSGSGSVGPTHRKRVSTASIPLSYAYGAPSVSIRSAASPKGTSYIPPSTTLSLNARRSKSPFEHAAAPEAEPVLSDREMENEDDNASQTSSRNAVQGSPAAPRPQTNGQEPASRYAKYRATSAGAELANHPKSIARPPRPTEASNPNTSVNIATAFRQAAASTSTASKNGFQSANGRQQAGSIDQDVDQISEEEEDVDMSQEDEEDQQEEMDESMEAEKQDESLFDEQDEQVPASIATRGKKRKLRKSTDSEYHLEQDASNNEEVSETESAEAASKRPRVAGRAIIQDGSMPPPTSSRKKKVSPRRKAVTRDNSYKPEKGEQDSNSSDGELGEGIAASRARRTPRNSNAADQSFATPHPPGAFISEPAYTARTTYMPAYLQPDQNQHQSSSTSSSPHIATYSMREREHSYPPYGDSSTFSQEEEIVTLLEQDRLLAQANRENARQRFKQFGLPVPSPSANRSPQPMNVTDPLLGGQDGGPVLADRGVRFGVAVREILLAVLEGLKVPLIFMGRGVNRLMEVFNKMPWSTAGKVALGVLILAVLVGSMLEDSSFRLKRPSRTEASYSAPKLPADDFDQLVERLSAVERATSELANSQRDYRSRLASEGQISERIVNRLDELDQRLQVELRQANEREQTRSRELLQTSSDLSGELRSLHTRFISLSDEMTSSTRRHQEGSTALQNLAQEVDLLSKHLKQTDTTLAAATKDLKQAISSQQATQIATEAIEKILPSRVAVRRDQKGNLVVDPAFWTQLKSAFAPMGASTNKGSNANTAVASWDAFLMENQHALKAFIDGDLEERVSSGALLSKRAFSDLLRKEVKLLKIDFEKQANANMQQIGEELLHKVAKQEKLRSEQDGKPVTVKLPSGGNANDLVQQLVDAALLRYSKDVLVKPDYALFTAGARVVPALTSQSYEARPSGLFRGLIASTTGHGIIRGRPPVTALHPDISVGSCWAFQGPTASLGVRLSRNVVVTDVTIEHASPDVAYDVSSAPADFEVWGLLDSESDILKVQQSRQNQSYNENLDQMSSVPPSPRHFLLVAGTYNPQATSHIQTFPVSFATVDLDVPVSMVNLRILGTQANGNGCLYRFRVGGTVQHE